LIKQPWNQFPGLFYFLPGPVTFHPNSKHPTKLYFLRSCINKISQSNADVLVIIFHNISVKADVRLAEHPKYRPDAEIQQIIHDLFTMVMRKCPLLQTR
jgi:hypothetical protein